MTLIEKIQILKNDMLIMKRTFPSHLLQFCAQDGAFMEDVMQDRLSSHFVSPGKVFLIFSKSIRRNCRFPRPSGSICLAVADICLWRFLNQGCFDTAHPICRNWKMQSVERCHVYIKTCCIRPFLYLWLTCVVPYDRWLHIMKHYQI